MLESKSNVCVEKLDLKICTRKMTEIMRNNYNIIAYNNNI